MKKIILIVGLVIVVWASVISTQGCVKIGGDPNEPQQQLKSGDTDVRINQ